MLNGPAVKQRLSFTIYHWFLASLAIHVACDARVGAEEYHGECLIRPADMGNDRLHRSGGRGGRHPAACNARE